MNSNAPAIAKSIPHKLPQCPSDSIAQLSWSNDTNPNFLAATSWDKTVRIWELKTGLGNAINSEAKILFQHDAPVLTSCFYQDNTKLFAGGCDNVVKMYDLNAGNTQGIVMAQHEQPVCKVAWSSQLSVLVTTSWDGNIKMWDGKSSTPVWQRNVQSKIYSMDLKGPILLISNNNRDLFVWNLGASLDAAPLHLKSPLKMQTRSLSLFSSGTPHPGAVVGSIEGRCAVLHFDEAGKSKNYCFKSHRIEDRSSAPYLYSVNSIDFHYRNPVFATGGSDGRVNLWHRELKVRVLTFERHEEPIVDCKFNCVNNWFAYAESYDWHKGADAQQIQKQNPQVYVHAFQEADFTPRTTANTRR